MYIIHFVGKTTAEQVRAIDARICKIAQRNAFTELFVHTYDTNSAVCRNFAEKFVQNA